MGNVREIGIMLSRFFQYYNFRVKPKLLGWITRFLYSNKNIIIGNNFTCDSIPNLFIGKNSSLTIGNNTQFRKDIEIRAHGQSLLKIGSNVRIDRGVRLLSTNQSQIVIGDRTAIGLYSVFNGGDDIILGEACLISGFVYLQTSMHSHDYGTYIKDQGFSHAPVILGNDIWLGAHAVILPGCHLSDGVIVGSNAVVTSPVDTNKIVGGVPAKVIGDRKKR